MREWLRGRNRLVKGGTVNIAPGMLHLAFRQLGVLLVRKGNYSLLTDERCCV